jgi:DNA polymerase-3 subunit delta
LINLLYGKDEFTIFEKVKKMRDELTPPELRDINTTILDGSELSLGELVSAAFTVPFMGEKRLIIVENLSARFESAFTDRNKGLGDWESISVDLDAIPATTNLVFKEGDLHARNPMLAILRNIAEVQTHPLLRSNDIPRWIMDRAGFVGISIEPQAAYLLAESVGAELRILDSELKKLSLYREDETIRKEDVAFLVSYVQDQSIFKVVDSAIEGKSADALRLSKQLISSGSSSAMIVRMIERQVRLLLLARDLRLRKVSTSSVGKRLSLSGFPLQKTLEMEKRIYHGRLEFIHEMILESDIRVRDGSISSDVALDLLLAELRN